MDEREKGREKKEKERKEGGKEGGTEEGRKKGNLENRIFKFTKVIDRGNKNNARIYWEGMNIASHLNLYLPQLTVSKQYVH